MKKKEKKQNKAKSIKIFFCALIENSLFRRKWKNLVPTEKHMMRPMYDDDDDKQNKMLHYNRDSIKTLTRLHFNAYKSNRGLTYIDIGLHYGGDLLLGEGYKVRSLSLALSIKSINDSTAIKIQQQ